MGIVQIIGITKHLQTNEYAFVMLYYQNSLQNLYQRKTFEIEWTECIRRLQYLTFGLKTIHDNKLVHHDFHSGNILLDNNNYPVISDFGLCKPVDITLNRQGGSYGVIPYMAPELFKGQPHSKATDIYAFGITHVRDFLW